MYTIERKMVIIIKTQLRKGVIEIYVLAMLSKEDSYGYEIVSNLSNYVEITESTLYPILRRLETSNELETYNVLYNGRNRKYYKINKNGFKHIEEFIEVWKETIDIYHSIVKGENHE